MPRESFSLYIAVPSCHLLNKSSFQNYNTNLNNSSMVGIESCEPFFVTVIPGTFMAKEMASSISKSLLNLNLN